jgi:hypothetical protein
MRKNNNKERKKTISFSSQTQAILISIVRRLTIEMKTTLHSILLSIFYRWAIEMKII